MQEEFNSVYIHPAHRISQHDIGLHSDPNLPPRTTAEANGNPLKRFKLLQ